MAAIMFVIITTLLRYPLIGLVQWQCTARCEAQGKSPGCLASQFFTRDTQPYLEVYANR